ncbi:phytase [Caulobacter mirabilis]|uniref:3-phytase n=1 Tax=Caulobacter mirabilis TaxID=69666 RepID=A0A2D2B0P9_9CAUL|nr:phytase [Caulobacter mirabilis]ATQ43843.1 3-phytase [Caulobacter mirabilis]
MTTARTTTLWTLRGLMLALLASTATAALAQTAVPSVTPFAETTPTVRSGANTAVLALDGAGGGRVVGSGELGGIEVYGLDGKRSGAIPAGDVTALDIRYGAPVGGREATVLGVLDTEGGISRLRFFDFDAATGGTRELTGAPITLPFAAESLCLYRSPLDRGLYAFALGGHGEIEQWAIHDDGAGRLAGKLVRRLHLASEAAYCTVDDTDGDLYVAEQAIGIWKFHADPEAETIPRLIDAVRLGALDKEVGGLALYDGGRGARYLIASNASANSFHVYDRDAKDRRVGSFTLTGVEAAGGLYATSTAGGLLIAMDDENAGGTNYKLARFADIAAALKLNAGTPQDPRVLAPQPLPTVTATVETQPVEGGGDAADDPAIWVHPTDPSKSLIIGTDKQAGLGVYDLSGKRVQFLADGRMNNVDLRDGFKLGGRSVTLVTASDRTKNAIAIYALDPATGRLSNVSDGVQPTGLGDPYGLCMYRSRKSGQTFVFINDTDGKMRQWRLVEAAGGKVRSELVREFAFDSQTEGCVADDELGTLYVAEEDVALWKLSAEPKGGSAKTMVASVAANPKLKDDLEGVSLYLQPKGRGYIVLSSQGNNSYALFRRDGTHDYAGSFAIIGDPAKGIDGASETDGLDVTSVPMGPAFPRGALVVQDGRNVSPPQPQNFKIVPWDAIAEALKLPE